ncbi:MAG TPA: nuclear transport factor 2 family protein, partial [Pseudonocardia sp.]|nr:nuclear transport factor 2 family protein [Pseudonocardia sp.]
MDAVEAKAFVERWVAHWNAHDLDALLEHFTEDVTFSSPAAIRVLGGGDGVVRGKAALRD